MGLMVLGMETNNGNVGSLKHHIQSHRYKMLHALHHMQTSSQFRSLTEQGVLCRHWIKRLVYDNHTRKINRADLFQNVDEKEIGILEVFDRSSHTSIIGGMDTIEKDLHYRLVPIETEDLHFLLRYMKYHSHTHISQANNTKGYSRSKT